MTYNVEDLPFSLQWPGARRLVEYQRQQLKSFDDLVSTMDNLWACCQTVRESAARKRRRRIVDGDQLQRVVEACEMGVLAQLSHGKRVQLLMEATDKTSSLIESWLPALGDLAVFAHAEIGLRVLIHLALESTGHVYEPDRRLPAWNRAIRDAESRAEMTVDAWRAFVRENTGMASDGD